MIKRSAFITALLISNAETASAQSDTTRFNLGCSTGACVIEPFEVQGPTPLFLIRNRSIKAQNLSVGDRLTYRRAERRFADTAACLTASDSGQGLDLATLKWSEISAPEHLKICLSHIHNALRNAENSRLWFETVGFRARIGTVRVFATWPPESAFPVKFSTKDFRKRTPTDGNVEVTIERGLDGRVINVEAGWVRE